MKRVPRAGSVCGASLVDELHELSLGDGQHRKLVLVSPHAVRFHSVSVRLRHQGFRHEGEGDTAHTDEKNSKKGCQRTAATWNSIINITPVVANDELPKKSVKTPVLFGQVQPQRVQYSIHSGPTGKAARFSAPPTRYKYKTVLKKTARQDSLGITSTLP